MGANIMQLYHGSNAIIEQVDLSKSRPYKDFGRGFYCTNLKLQAEAMARRVSKLYGGTPFVTEYQLDHKIFDDSTVNIMTFESPSTDWAQFVMNNRKKVIPDSDHSFSNHDNRFDLVVGPVADDEMYAQFQLLQEGIIDLQVLAKKLEFMQHSNQYSFHSAKSLQYLLFVEGYECLKFKGS
jgi:hypothetical protein